jgi:hypothetical protein
MKKHILYLAFIISTSFFIGCNKNNNLLTNPNNEVPSESVVVPLSPIDSKINVQIIFARWLGG